MIMESGTDGAERSAPLSRLQRSSHTAFIDHNTLYVWGGFQEVAGEDVVLPSDEIWLYNLDRQMWERQEITGDKPPELLGSCGAHVNGTLYIFAGRDSTRYTNEMFSVDLSEQHYSWKRVSDTKGMTPSPRNKHSCWVHRDRLIYFGGYGCKTMAQSTSTASFSVEEMSWKTIGNSLFRCWGWNNEVNIFDPNTATWSMPETQGLVPTPRGCHASALLGSKGYISGRMEATELDMFCLDLETWTWTQFDISLSSAPLGRSMFTMTPVWDHTLLVYGGVSTDGDTLNDAWHFNTQTCEWTKITHPHLDKPRVCHTACLGIDTDVVVFGGSSNMCILVDSISKEVAAQRTPSQRPHGDVFIFQTQPYSLCRLCEDFIGRNPEVFGKQLHRLPSQLQREIKKRVATFSAPTPALTAPVLSTD